MVTSSPSPPQEVLTLQEAADYLKVSERTLWVRVQAGEIPCFKVGSQYRFHLRALRELGAQSKEMTP